jgi:Putative Ig domain
MPLTVWTQPSGYSFGTIYAEQPLDIALPVSNDSGVTYKVISGALPDNVFLVGNHLVGSPFVLKNQLAYNFCIRASLNGQISDRTFNLNLLEVNVPTFITPEGQIKQLYVLDQTYVSYQLEAYDLNASGTLNYFIASNDGNLPPGLTLSPTGLISGYIEPNYSILPTTGSGNYDASIFDTIGYDFGLVSTNGFDDYAYDDVFFDYNIPTQRIITLSANYQFRVTLTDGINSTQRIFRIFVVGNDEFRADSTALNGFMDGFTADATYIRTPYWITDSNLGVFRANNYVTIPVGLYDANYVTFREELTNQEVYTNAHQINPFDNILGSYTVTITNTVGTPQVGQYFGLEYYVTNATGTAYKINNVAVLGTNSYRLTIDTALEDAIDNGTPFYIGSLSTLPTGLSFDVQSGDLFGIVPYQPAITKTFKFTLTASRYGTNKDYVSNSRTFTITIIGDLNSIITWQTPSNLGSIPANYICTLSVYATTNISGANVIYQITDGSLPPGLTLNPDGEIIGTVNQFYNNLSGQKGLITFNNGATTFDQGTTTFDRTYTFTITASDQYGYNTVPRQFTINITTPNTQLYSNITARPFLNSKQRTAWQNFINDTSIFTPDSIYRTNDPNFGIQTTMSMLIYAGIQTEHAAAYVGAMGLGVKKKRFIFGDVKTAVAIDPNTRLPVYEVVYVQMLDPLEPNGKHLPLIVKTPNVEPETITVDDSNSIWSDLNTDLSADAPNAVRPDYNITIDSTGYLVSNPNTDEYFPSSITNWRTRISDVGATERDYLPLWMRSIPSGQKAELDYVLAIPLCFCKVGTSNTIALNIEFSGFDFKTIDYTIDRFTIDSVTGYVGTKYLVFKNDRITV